MTVKELAKKAGVSRGTVYTRIKELNRLPTLDELKKRDSGRPAKNWEIKKND